MRRDTLLSSFLTLGCAGSLAFLLFRVELWARNDLRIRIWDVGQGDSISIYFPDRTHWMIDTGGKWGHGSIASRAQIPGLSMEGSFHIHRLILSHPDEDHAFGALDLLARLRVGELWVHGGFQTTASQSRLLREIVGVTQNARENARVPLRWLSTQMQENQGGVSVNTIAVHAGTQTNNQELVLLLSYRGCRLLFLGDSEKPAEAFVAKQLTGPVDFLKVAHHGSRTSSTGQLLQRARPLLSAISVGENNRYGHPHRQVVARLREQGSQVLRTDRHGFVELRVTPSGTLHCQSFSGLCGELQCRGLR